MLPPLLYDPANLSTLREVLSQLEAAPNRTLGQNFLVNAGILDKTVAASQVSAGDHVLEIGPGPGALTVRLLSAGCNVTSVEKDRKFAAFLAGRLADYPLRLVENDALDVKWEELGLPDSGVHVVANLPYAISKPIMRRFLEEWRPHLRSVTVLVQKEVALRLVAGPGTAEYGPLSIMTTLWGQPRRAFDVAPGSFFPAPNVTSSVVHIPLRSEPAVPVTNEDAFWRVIRCAFAQRRKQLLNTLAPLGPRARLKAALEAASIEPQRRGETLSIEEFSRLSDALTI